MAPEWAEITFAIVAVLVTARAYLDGAARPTPEDRERGRRAGGIMMLAGVAVGSAAAGSVFAQRPAGDLAPAAAWLGLAAAALALTSGAALRTGARERPKVQRAVVRGRGRIHTLREGHPGVHGTPVWEVGLEVTAPGIAPFAVDVFAELPRSRAETLEVGGDVAVLVEGDPVSRVSLDWADTEGAAAGDEYEAPVAVTAGGPPLAARGTTSPFGRTVKVLLPFAIAAFVASLAGGFFESRGGAPATVAPTGGAGVPAETVSSPRGVEPAFSFTVPEGWRALPGEDRSPLRGIEPDVVMVRADGTAAASVAGRLRGLDASGRSLAEVLPVIERRLRASVVPSTIAAVDGEPAVALDLGAGPKVEIPMVAVVRGGRVVIVVALGVPSDDQSLGSVVEAIVESWSWSRR